MNFLQKLIRITNRRQLICVYCSVSRMDVSVQCCMVDWPEEVSFVPYFAPLREDDLETDALGRKCPNFYSLPGEDKKCK